MTNIEQWANTYVMAMAMIAVMSDDKENDTNIPLYRSVSQERDNAYANLRLECNDDPHEIARHITDAKKRIRALWKATKP